MLHAYILTYHRRFFNTIDSSLAVQAKGQAPCICQICWSSLRSCKRFPSGTRLGLLHFCTRECSHQSVPFICEQSKVVFVLEPVTEGVALAQVSLIGKAKLE